MKVPVLLFHSDFRLMGLDEYRRRRLLLYDEMPLGYKERGPAGIKVLLAAERGHSAGEPQQGCNSPNPVEEIP